MWGGGGLVRASTRRWKVACVMICDLANWHERGMIWRFWV